MTTTPGRSIALASLLNLRDLCGYPTADGRRVRMGLVFRSTDLSGLDDSDLPTVAALGLHTVVDLRTEVVLDVLADAAGKGPAQLLALMTHPAHAAEVLCDDRAEALFAQAYRQIVASPSALDSYRRFFALLGRRLLRGRPRPRRRGAAADPGLPHRVTRRAPRVGSAVSGSSGQACFG